MHSPVIKQRISRKHRQISKSGERHVTLQIKMFPYVKFGWNWKKLKSVWAEICLFWLKLNGFLLNRLPIFPSFISRLTHRCQFFKSYLSFPDISSFMIAECMVCIKIFNQTNRFTTKLISDFLLTYLYQIWHTDSVLAKGPLANVRYSIPASSFRYIRNFTTG